ncbi:MAG TPA: hypothetical protein VGF13_16695, partial [Verrucomicrobiae bacterium]
MKQSLINHPWVLLVAGAVLGALASIPVALWFLERPHICWVTNPVRSVIVKRDQTSAFRVSFFGADVTNDVSSVQLQIWNKGRKA